MKTRTRLGLGFAGQVLITAILGVGMMLGLGNVKRQFSFVVEHDAPVIANARQLSKLVVDMETGQRGFCITHKEEFLEPYIRGGREFDLLIDKVKRLVSEEPLQVELLELIAGLVQEWKTQAAEPEIAMARRAAAHVMDAEHLQDVLARGIGKSLMDQFEAGVGKRLMDKIRKKFEIFIAVEEGFSARRFANASRTAAATKKTALTLFALALGLGIGLAVITSRAISVPLAQLVTGAETVGDGDLNTRVRIDSTDEFGNLGRAFNVMTEKLKEGVARRKEEKHLRESRDYADNVIKSISDALIVTDAKGKIGLVNQATVELLGYTEEEILGTPIRLLMDEERSESLVATSLLNENGMKDLLGKGFVGNLEVQYVAKHGKKISMILSAAVMRTTDRKVSNIVWIGKDITERKKSEESLRTLQKLESLGVMAGGIAHDFNNIMTGILGNLSLAKEEVNGGTEIRELIVESQNACMSAKGLTKQLLTFAKGGNPVINIAEVGSILKESCTFAARGSKAKCRFRIDKDLLSVKVDRDQIAQVFQNLVINASQSMLEGGRITISASNVHLTAEAIATLEPGPYIRIQVVDAGIGMSEEILPRIFDPYFSTKGSGRGLGLATCHSIIVKHQGHMEAMSQAGQGTTFTVYLPATAAVEVSSEIEPVVTGTATGRVLIMDDDPLVSRTFARILKRLGSDCEIVNDGETALAAFTRAQLSETPFDLVVMDLTIPGGMGGRDAAKRLKERYPDAKAIVSSGYSNDPVMANYSAYGFEGMLTKPYRVEEVAKVLNELLGVDSNA